MDNIILSSGTWTLELSEQGHIHSLRSPLAELVLPVTGSAICEVLFVRSGKRFPVTSGRLRRHTASHAEFETVLDAGVPVTLRFAYDISEPDEHGTAVKCKVEFQSDSPLDTDVDVWWFWGARLRATETLLFVPLFDGRGLRTSRRKRRTWYYECAGGGREGERIALPLVDEGSMESPLRVAYFADPFFSTVINLPSDGTPELFHCRYLCSAGSRQFPERVFGLYLHDGDADTALEGFFRSTMPNCPPGPDWLHEIAMVHYDYLSEEGQGWFKDIDRLVQLISPDDRKRVVMTLHGWYDTLGRYCFDEHSQKLDRQWVVMPKGRTREMTLEDMHRRVAYAKERGFRVLLYFADGLAIDSGAPNYDENIVLLEPDGNLRKHHWAGPDTLAQTYIMNPLHPRVQNFFRGYMTALLQEFGGEIDGLAWDETFTIRAGDLSGGEHPGYADREFMLLCYELHDLVKVRNPDIAFLASDCTGLRLPQEDGTYWHANPAQNAIVLDGTYQDSQCYPTAWQYGLFPNYRNTLWSCNWRPVENFEWTVLGVKAFGAPVAISNGWGENKGISRYSDIEIEKLLGLFNLRKEQQSRVRWIECREV